MNIEVYRNPEGKLRVKAIRGSEDDIGENDFRKLVVETLQEAVEVAKEEAGIQF